jgi:hypothetical protein
VGSGVTSANGYGTPNDYFITNRFQYLGDVNLTLGGHALQYGGMVERLQFNQGFPNYVFGAWTFGSLTGFLAGNETRFRGATLTADPILGTRQWFFALYLQDDWKVNSNLTLNLGLPALGALHRSHGS